jgi:hypothetical protein
MKKQIISLSLVAAVAVGFTGCLGGGNSLKVPNAKQNAKAREQKIDENILPKVASKGHDDFIMTLANKRFATPFTCKVGFTALKKETNSQLAKDNLVLTPKGEYEVAVLTSKGLEKLGLEQCIKNDRTVSLDYLKSLQNTSPVMYDLIKSTANHVSKLFEARTSYIEKHKELQVLLQNNLDNILIAQINHFPKMTARYFPVGHIVLAGIDENKLKTDKAYQSKFVFLVAHELVHAYALHTSEELTSKKGSRIGS